MSQLRTNFIGWQPDQDEYSPEGLITANNVLHDTEGYKPLYMQTVGAFGVSTWYSGSTLHSVRSMQIRSVGAGNNRVAALAVDASGTTADLSIGVEGEASAFTTVTTATLASVGGIRCKAFSVGELESGVFLICAAWGASLAAGGSTLYSITGEVTYTITSEEEDPGSGATTSLEGTDSTHTQTRYNDTAYSGIYLKSDGVEYSVDEDNTPEGATLTSWLDSGMASGVWVYATVTSGSIDVDAGTGVWLPMSTSRKWAKSQSAFGTGVAVVELTAADNESGTSVIDSATYTLTSIKAGTSLAGTQSTHENSASSGTVWAGVNLHSNGTEYSYSAAGSSTGNNLGAWLEGGANTDFWVRCTTSDSLDGTSSATGSWLAMSTSRAWAVSKATGFGVTQATLTIEIATDSGGANIIDSQNYTIRAVREL